jgi:hypothetical protein
MHRQDSFKKPTIKATNRSYVRLFGNFTSPEAWLEFLDPYRIEPFDFGMQWHGGCAVRVVAPTTGHLATLGLEIPNAIKYHTYVATARSFWQECFLSNSSGGIGLLKSGMRSRRKMRFCRGDGKYDAASATNTDVPIRFGSGADILQSQSNGKK